ncbi:carbohydrate kinase [Pedobacter yulinensis]|uniref:Carbohydrate kinase n=1 Tax=Pedobacter yulinensis TaxID=2126353 RepID=A0A2T3HN58_9SPHI|nr:sugar kinase [Pedobacter yulinensis]PST83847.1 carbohydrate kinase [Pedobacter yulinensis]
MSQEEHILIFGELLLRFSSTGQAFIKDENLARVFVGGAEANAAASLGRWGVPCAYLSRIPDNALAAQALAELERRGVDTSHVLRGGDRLGQYFLLSADGLSKGEVVYDRKYSSFSDLRPGMIDWETVLRSYTRFHWTALTPALNPHMAGVCAEALQTARKLGLSISVDLNYRNRLWDFGKEPIEVMPELVSQCDVVMGNIWAAGKMLGIAVSDGLERSTPPVVYREEAARSAALLMGAFPNCRHVAYTFRFMDNPAHNLFYGTYHQKNGNFNSAVYETTSVVDRIGSGDAFMAGLLFALCTGKTGQEVIDLATAAGYKKLFVAGDFGDGAI